MDTFRRAFLPVLVVVVLLGALVFRLASCSPDAAGRAQASETPANTSAAVSGMDASPSPGAKTPKPPYSGAEIKRIYENLGLSVVEIRDAGDATMVHYYKPTGVPGEIISRFDWFDRTTGARELLYGPAYTDGFEVRPDKSFTVLTKGVSYNEGIRMFPEIVRAFYSDVDGAVTFTRTEEKYFAPLDKSYSIGPDRHACLADINVTPGFVSLGFGPQSGYESEFYAVPVSIPKMDIKIADGLAAFTLYKTSLVIDPEILSVKGNSYCSVVSVTSDGTNTVITLRLDASVSRYNVSVETSPATGLPYAVLEFTGAVYDYPAGW